MALTTGIITNTRATGTAATNIVVSSRNETAAPASVVVQIFVVPSTTLVLTPIYVTGYIVPAYSADIRTFTVSGNIAYEVQLVNNTALANVVFSTFGIDEFGNLVQEQGFPQTKMTVIPALTPILM
ncbi:MULTISPECIES: hypothetical protein [Paenibacillus]|uniref:hypothetical protein n=1 Tax=Paenibacillus TaxID=44249 RepID=UPI00038FEF90|nr:MULTISPECIES: hypothetical protein [Paenibacillus]KKC49033.1 hypothetical protein VE23_21210 [Paenibacillus sp. D9]CDN42243.1 Uncharacterized protein BN871_BA_00180 [Paenibacillus sp. P22]